MKKTIFVLAIIAALAIALYKWLTNGENEEQKQETTEEVKEPANNETENVKPETNAEEVKNGNDTVNENHK
jgi:sortase (surface protein transpeptidase)